jgi:N-acetylglucosaminyl-diphospho-decaprenol L-rhamnosyltransferase
VDLSVVIVSYNTRDLLRGCLASVLAETRQVTSEVIVVDNASPDGSAAMVASEFPGLTLLAFEDNVGFARACNLGVEASSGDYILLLNPDTTVHDRALERLLEFGRSRPQAGLCGGRTLRPTGGVDPSSCWGQPTLWSLFCFSAGLSTVFRHSRIFDPESLGRWERDSVREVGVVTGCLLLASRQVWDSLGGFDERFWMYGEDADLALRARALGYRPAITPDAVVTHVVGASASGPWKRRLLLRGKVTFVTKNWPPASARMGTLFLAGGVAVRAAGARLLRRSSPWPEVWDQRSEWLHGWPEAAAVPPAAPSASS